MKAITIWQPWASLIAYGYKIYETRHYRPLSIVGDRIAIHAGLRDPHENAWWKEVADYVGLVRIVERMLLAPEVWVAKLPRGAVIATAVVTGWTPTETIVRIAELGEQGHREQLLQGNFAPGRFAWHLEDVRRVEPPVPARGRQGMWDWTPGDLRPHLDAQAQASAGQLPLGGMDGEAT